MAKKEKAPQQQREQLEQRPDEGAAELGALLKKAPKREVELPRVGALVRIKGDHIPYYRPLFRWITARHTFRVQLVDRLGSRPMLVLQEVDSRDGVAAELEHCEVIS